MLVLPLPVFFFLLLAWPRAARVAHAQDSADDFDTGGDASLSKKALSAKWGGCCCGGALDKMCPPAEIVEVCAPGGGMIVEICNVANVDTCCPTALSEKIMRQKKVARKKRAESKQKTAAGGAAGDGGGPANCDDDADDKEDGASSLLQTRERLQASAEHATLRGQRVKQHHKDRRRKDETATAVDSAAPPCPTRY